MKEEELPSSEKKLTSTQKAGKYTQLNTGAFTFSSLMNEDIIFPPRSNLKYAKVEHCQMSFWDSQKLPTQDYNSGLPNEQIFIMLATTQTAMPSYSNCSVTSRTLSPMCSVFPILNANIFQTSWQ